MLGNIKCIETAVHPQFSHHYSVISDKFVSLDCYAAQLQHKHNK